MFKLLACTLASAACSESQHASTDGKAGSSAAGSGGHDDAEAGSGGDAGKAGGQAVDTTLVVHNDGDNVLLLGNSCGGLWLSMSERGEDFHYEENCSCPCSGTSICGCPAFCVNTQQLLVPGESASIPWDGVARDMPTAACFDRRIPETGSELTAKACWNQNYQDRPEDCGEKTFAYGTDTTVTVSAHGDPPKANATGVTLQLTNSTDSPIEIRKEFCGAQDWFHLDMGEALSLFAFCPCACGEDFKQASCPVCGACAGEVIQTLAPGETAEQVWDGMFNYLYASGCSGHYTMPTGTQVKGKVCWRKVGETDDTCAPVLFEAGQDYPVKL